MRSTQTWLLVAVALLGGAAPAYVACSSSSGDGFEPDAGVDGTFEAAVIDHAAPVEEDAADAAPPPTEASTVVGKCEPVVGPACDLVLQDCPATGAGAPQECTVANGGPPYKTACVAATSSEHLGKGHGCCASASDKQCDPGLECTGDPNAPCDGGVATGRCSPHCCGSAIDGGDDYLCGQSDPEGYQGHCDTQVVDSTDTPLYGVCSYTRPCEPFGVKPCPSGGTCDFRDTTGSAGCDDIYSPDGGVPGEGAPCYALNGCADGLACLGSGTPGVCTMMCLRAAGKPPFDAGALDGGPFGGGCSPGKTCGTGTTDGFPPWISFCN
jgi:hypothetical protein